MLRFIDSHYKYGSLIPLDEFEGFTKQLKLNSDQINNIKEELYLMYVRIGPSYKALFEELDTFIDEEKNIEVKVLNTWYKNRKINPISQERIERVLLSRGYSIMGREKQNKDLENIRSASELLNYIVEYYEESKEISNKKLRSFFDQYKIEKRDQNWIYKELEILDFKITISEFDKVLNEVLLLFDQGKTIEKDELKNWFENEHISLNVQTKVIKYLEKNGYIIRKFSENESVNTLISYIAQTYGKRKKISRELLVDLFHQYDIDSKEQKMILNELKVLNFSITIPTRVLNLKKLLPMIPDDEEFDLNQLEKWYVDEEVREINHKRTVSDSDLEEEDITVEFPYEEEIKKLVSDQSANGFIDKAILTQWYKKEDISIAIQEQIEVYIRQNGFAISEQNLQEDIQKDGNIEIFIDFIYDNFKFGSQLSEEYLDNLFNKFHITKNSEEAVYQELESLNISIIRTNASIFEQKLAQLLQLIDSNKSIDSLKIKEWYEEENIKDQDKTKILDYLQSNEYVIIDTDSFEDEVDESVNKLTDYIESHLKFGSSISERQFNTLLGEFQIKDQNQNYIYELLKSLQINVIKSEEPFQHEIAQLVSFIGESQEIRETALKEWYKNFGIDQNGQLVIRAYLDSNGFSVINNRKRLMEDPGLEFLEGIDSRPLEQLLASEEFKEVMDSFEEIADSRYNIDYLESYAEGNFEVQSDALEKIVVANSRLVMKIVQKYKHFETGSYSEEDMMQAGMCGLMKAAEKFDVSLGYQFSTYATHWIRQAISREIGDLSTTIRVPIHMREEIYKYIKIKNNFWNTHSAVPSVKKIAELMSVEEGRVLDLQKYSDMAQMTSLDAPIGEERASSLGEFIVDNSTPTPEDHAEKELLKVEINEIISNNLTHRESEILILRFGLDGQEKHTLEQIGAMYGVTRERIRQIEQKALRKLGKGSSKERLMVFADDFR